MVLNNIRTIRHNEAAVDMYRILHVESQLVCIRTVYALYMHAQQTSILALLLLIYYSYYSNLQFKISCGHYIYLFESAKQIYTVSNLTKDWQKLTQKIPQTHPTHSLFKRLTARRVVCCLCCCGSWCDVKPQSSTSTSSSSSRRSSSTFVIFIISRSSS
jgi:hypothetical protein